MDEIELIQVSLEGLYNPPTNNRESQKPIQIFIYWNLPTPTSNSISAFKTMEIGSIKLNSPEVCVSIKQIAAAFAERSDLCLIFQNLISAVDLLSLYTTTCERFTSLGDCAKRRLSGRINKTRQQRKQNKLRM